MASLQFILFTISVERNHTSTNKNSKSPCLDLSNQAYSNSINVYKFPTWLGSSGWFLTRIEDKVYTSVCIVSQGLLVAMSKILQRKMTSSLLQQLSKLLLFSKFTKGSSSNENNCGVQIRLTAMPDEYGTLSK